MNEGKNTTKKVCVICHGTQESSPCRGHACWSPDLLLTPYGVQQMKWVIDRNPGMRRNYSVFASSPLPRAVLSLTTMMLHLGRPPKDMDKIRYAPQLWSYKPDIWCTESTESGDHTVCAAYRRDSHAVANDGHRVVAYCRELLKCMKAGEAALCLSHRGPLDAAAILVKHHFDESGYGHEDEGFRTWRDFYFAEGAIFVFSDIDALVGIEEIRG